MLRAVVRCVLVEVGHFDKKQQQHNKEEEETPTTPKRKDRTKLFTMEKVDMFGLVYDDELSCGLTTTESPHSMHTALDSMPELYVPLTIEPGWKVVVSYYAAEMPSKQNASCAAPMLGIRYDAVEAGCILGRDSIAMLSRCSFRRNKWANRIYLSHCMHFFFFSCVNEEFSPRPTSSSICTILCVCRSCLTQNIYIILLQSPQSPCVRISSFQVS